MVLYGTLLVAALLAALLVRRYDMHDREPWPMLLIAAALGAGAMWALGFVEQWTIDAMPSQEWHELIVATVAATHEESARLLIVISLAVFLPRWFNDPMDGVIYGSIIGLGMAVEESVFYLQLWGLPRTVLPATEFVRLAGHLIMGGITGFGIGMARMGMNRWVNVSVGCVFVSILLHLAWDWLAFSAGRRGRMEWEETASAVALMSFGLLFYGMLVVTGSDWSKRLFAPHSVRQLWGWPLSLLLGHDKVGA